MVEGSHSRVRHGVLLSVGTNTEWLEIISRFRHRCFAIISSATPTSNNGMMQSVDDRPSLACYVVAFAGNATGHLKRGFIVAAFCASGVRKVMTVSKAAIF